MHDRPMARTEGIFSEPVNGELVIYDALTQIGHALSPQAASVWKRCDGQTSRAEMSQDLALEPDTVDQTVHQLHDSGLLEDDGPEPERVYSRRDAAVGLAKAGGAAFLVYSMAIPPAAGAASACVANQGSQTAQQCSALNNGTAADALCCSGRCKQVGGVRTCCAPALSACLTDADCCTTGAVCSSVTHVCLT